MSESSTTKSDNASGAASRRPVMVLYSDAAKPLDHSVRLVLAEKDVNVEIKIVSDEFMKGLEGLNPYNTTLTLVDRKLVLYEANIITDYIDERYPHPPLLPIDPGGRAENRQLRYRITRDMYTLAEQIEGDDEVKAAAARKELRDQLTSIAPIFAHKDYFMSETFTLADCCMAPLLWRLRHYGIVLPASARALREYGERLFQRKSFERSLSALEREY